MRHVIQLLLCVIDGRDNRSREFLERFSQAELLWCRLASSRAALGLGSDMTIRIQNTERSIALLQDAATFLDERLNVVDELFLVQLVLGRGIRLVHVVLDLLADGLHTLK